MKRKIGEIFEHNGEWHQCVESTHGIVGACEGCSFYTIERLCSQSANDSILGHCDYIHRIDDKNVIFKKLEKVGEPYMMGNKLIQRYKIYPTTCCINVYGWYYQNLDVKSWTIDIEIKQNKEDMEETKLNIKPFSLEAAKAGKPVCTRDGRKARIICFDANIMPGNKNILALIRKDDGSEYVEYYTSNGKFSDSKDDINDLMMLPKKKEGWIKVKKDVNLYDTKEEADRKMIGNDEYVTAKVEWEE